MANRKPIYLLLILIQAVLCTFPQALFVYREVARSLLHRQFPFQLPYNFGRVAQANDVISRASFWQDRFVFPIFSHGGKNANFWNLTTVDPRTKRQTIIPLGAETPGNWGIQSVNFGSRLFLVGKSNAFEVIDGVAKPTSMTYPIGANHEQTRFLLAGEPAVILPVAGGFAVSTFDGTGWIVTSNLVLPDSSSPKLIDGVAVNFNKATNAICLNQGDRVHLFLDIEGRMLHHEGLNLRAVTSPTSKSRPAETPVSALEAANTPGNVAGWTVVNREAIPGSGKLYTTFPTLGNQLALLVNGRPVVLIVDDSNRGEMIGHLFRFENGRWSEFATPTFPFGTRWVRAVVSDDCQTSFIVTTSSTGLAYAYEVNAAGVRLTEGTPTPKLESFVAMQSLTYVGQWLCFALMLAGLFVLSAALSMRRFTSPDYVFGSQQVKLAAIGWRALARLIDVSLVVLSTAGLAWWLTRSMDWLSLVEALNLQSTHSSVQSAVRILCTLVLWVLFCEMLIVVAQARWGVTLGKWCCGLRTKQTSLRPCGIARCLVREFMLWFDTCSFLCWTPGIASIALTERRQRLGDLVADTIVVNASSIISVIPVQTGIQHFPETTAFPPGTGRIRS